MLVIPVHYWHMGLEHRCIDTGGRRANGAVQEEGGVASRAERERRNK